MTWPPGTTAGIPWYTGSSAWGGVYTTGNPIPANLIANPLTQNTTGNAGTATALQAAPPLCPVGQYARGILATGNATGCTVAAAAGGITSINASTVAAQTIVQGAGIGVSTNTSTGTTTITNTGAVQEIVFHGTPDAVKDTTCSTTNGSTNLTCMDAPFATCPTGKTVSVTDGILQSFTSGGTAFTYGNSLITTISSCTSSTVAVMAAPATNNTTNVPARWGTDNGPALISQATASTVRGNTFVIPPGNYLVRTTQPGSLGDAATGNAIDVYPNTSYVVMGGTNIYWIGPKGCDGNDTTCQTSYGLGEDGHRLFHLHDAGENFGTGTWPPAHNVHIQVDGVIEGDLNPNSYGTTWNNSAVIGWYGLGKTWGVDNVYNVTIDGSGTFANAYGFGVHGITGQNTNVRNLIFTHVQHALNVNATQTNQSFNVINGLGTVESTGSDVVMIGNTFNNSYGVSLGGTGGNTVCGGFIFAGNVFSNSAGTNINAAMCLVGATITGNHFWVPAAAGGNNYTAINFHDGPDTTTTHDNLISNNTFDGAAGCYAMVVSLGVYTGANVYSGNHVVNPCYFGYLFYNGYNGSSSGPPAKPEIIKNDSLSSTSGGDLYVVATDVVRLQGLSLTGGMNPSFPSSSYTADSFYVGIGGMYVANTVSSTIKIPTILSALSLATDATGKIIAGTGGGGVPNVGVPFTNVTSVTIPAATSNTTSKNVLVECYDTATPANRIIPGSVTVDPTSFQIVVTFSSSTSGYCAVNSSGGGGGPGGGVNSVTGTAPIVTTGTTAVTVSLANSGVTANNYTNPNITVDAFGRITAASNGTGGGLTDPGANGIVYRSGLNTTRPAVVADYPTLNQSTTGNAATATGLSTNGTANQVWGMNSGGTAQGWQTGGTGSGNTTSTGLVTGNLPKASGATSLIDSGIPASSIIPAPTGTGFVNQTGPTTLIAVPSTGTKCYPFQGSSGTGCDSPTGSTTTRTWRFDYQGTMQGGNCAVGVNFPTANAPALVNGDASHITCEWQLAQGTTTQNFWVKLHVPVGHQGAYTVKIVFRSSGTTGSANLQPSVACVAAGAVPDNPLFSSAGITALGLTPAATSLQNVFPTPVTFTPTCADDADLYVSFIPTTNTINGPINISYIGLSILGTI